MVVQETDESLEVKTIELLGCGVESGAVRTGRRHRQTARSFPSPRLLDYIFMQPLHLA